MTPHPQRCEICNPKCADYLVVQKQERIFNQGHLKQMERFSVLRGCASHSSARSEQSIRQSERDKVLDMFLTKILEKCNVEIDEDTKQILSYPKVSLDEILEIREELRSKGGEQG